MASFFKHLYEALTTMIENMDVPVPLGDSVYLLDHFKSAAPKYAKAIMVLEKNEASFATHPQDFQNWISNGVRGALNRAAKKLVSEGASAVFVSGPLKCVSVQEKENELLFVEIAVPVRAVGKTPDVTKIVDAAEMGVSVENVPYLDAVKKSFGFAKTVEPIYTLKRWVGKWPSAVLVDDPQAGDYGYFENAKQEMFFDGISWIPVKDFLDMHNKHQAKLAFEVESKGGPKESEVSLLFLDTVDKTTDLAAIKDPPNGACCICKENNKVYTWNGHAWLSLEGVSGQQKSVFDIAKAQQKKKQPQPTSQPVTDEKPESAEIFPRKRIIERRKQSE